MWFSSFKKERIESLKMTPRVLGGNDPKNPGLNFVEGLLDLIAYCKPKSVVEIGVNTGVSTECFLLNCQFVGAIDPHENPAAHNEFMLRCSAYPNLDYHRQYSYQGLGVPNHSVDMVYIDGMHDYWSVYNDIKIAETVLKKGGWLAGHDYVKDDPSNTEVPKAVLELFGKEPDKVFSDTSWIIKC